MNFPRTHRTLGRGDCDPSAYEPSRVGGVQSGVYQGTPHAAHHVRKTSAVMNRLPFMGGLVALVVVLTSCVTHEQPSSLPSTVERPTFTSTVLSVTDGDTLTVLVNGTREKVRLTGIDCPESDQSFGRQATQLATQLALEKTVTVTDLGRDRYRRMLGVVVLPDGRILNQELVR